jgi:hypothetical protein
MPTILRLRSSEHACPELVEWVDGQGRLRAFSIDAGTILLLVAIGVTHEVATNPIVDPNHLNIVPPPM